MVGIGISAALHLAAGYYLYTTKFKLREFKYSDEAVDVELVDPFVPPPPPPPPPPPDVPPPPKLQVREAVNVDAVNAPPPLVIETTKKEDRVEQQGPPVVTQSPPRPPVITRPDWARLPDARDLERFYPPRAREQEVEGRSTIRCSVTAQGTLVDCSVVSESPDGYGFGEAAVRMSSRFRMRPRTIDGQPVEGGTVTVPIRWQLGG